MRLKQDEHPSVLPDSLGEHRDSEVAHNTASVSLLHRIDGGISLLIRSPGNTIPDDSSVNGITLDTYLTPRAVADAGNVVQDILATFVQVFGKNAVLPHLHRFTQRCELERVEVPFSSCMWQYSLIYHFFLISARF